MKNDIDLTKTIMDKFASRLKQDARVFSESVEMKITVSVTAEAEVITYPQALLSVAKGLMDGG